MLDADHELLDPPPYGYELLRDLILQLTPDSLPLRPYEDHEIVIIER